VEFDGGNVSESSSMPSAGHSRNRSEESRKERHRGGTKVDDRGQAIQPSAVGISLTNVASSPSSPGDTSAEYKASHRTRHSRYQTEFAPSNYTIPDIPPFNALASPILKDLSSTQDRTAKRRARVSASAYEPSSMFVDRGEDAQVTTGTRDSADVYRKRIEALKNDMGDGWLKVFSQTQMKSPS